MKFRLPSKFPWRALAWLWFGSVMPMLAGSVAFSASKTRLYVDYSARPNLKAMMQSDLCILDPACDVVLTDSLRAGRTFLAYISVGEILPGTPTAVAAQAKGITLAQRNPDWGGMLLDIRHPEWADFILQKLIAPALAKGYDGVLLDTLDSVVPTDDKTATEIAVRLIRRIHSEYPNKLITTNRGFTVSLQSTELLAGVLVEGLYQTWEGKSKSYRPQTPADTAWLLGQLHPIHTKGLLIFVVDYVDPRDRALASKTRRRIQALGFIPFIGTPDLQGNDSIHRSPSVSKPTAR